MLLVQLKGCIFSDEKRASELFEKCKMSQLQKSAKGCVAGCATSPTPFLQVGGGTKELTNVVDIFVQCVSQPR
jgi:hypothetical protein